MTSSGTSQDFTIMSAKSKIQGNSLVTIKSNKLNIPESNYCFLRILMISSNFKSVL